MDINPTIRKNQLQNLHQFIETSKNNLKAILDELGWSEEEIKKENYLVNCIYDKSHKVSSKNLENHIKQCIFKRMGYTSEDQLFSEPAENGNSSIIIDDTTKATLFNNIEEPSSKWKADPQPKTSDRYLSSYNPEQRLCLYNYTVANVQGPEELPEFTLVHNVSNDSKEMSYKEMLEAERNAKRRRIKYKSVHTSHKSHVEIMRELINNQMELYAEYQASKHEAPKVTDVEENLLDDQRSEPFVRERSCLSRTSSNSSHRHHHKSSRRHSSGERHSSRSRIGDHRDGHKRISRDKYSHERKERKRRS